MESDSTTLTLMLDKNRRRACLDRLDALNARASDVAAEISKALKEE